MTLDKTIRIGRVTRAHGVTGELEVRPDWEHSRSLLEAREVVLEALSGELEAHAVRSVRQTPKGILVLLDGITDRDAAEARRGNSVRVSRDLLPSLATGEYYLCDLVGASVDCADGHVGVVTEIQMYPSVDSIVIEAPDGTRFEQPLLDEWIERVDVAQRQVALVSREGLIEEPKARAMQRPDEP